MKYTEFGFVAGMTKSEARRIIRNMLSRSRDIESPDYEMFTQPQYVALLTLTDISSENGKYQAD